MSLHASVDLRSLIWQDLYDFIDLARTSGVPGAQVVDISVKDDDPDVIERLEVELPGPIGPIGTHKPQNRGRDIAVAALVSGIRDALH
jgi:hypothetical protein